MQIFSRHGAESPDASWSRLWIYEAVVYGIGLVIATGLIPAWGRWYSPGLYYRQQVEALLRGSLGLSTNPGNLEFDLAWANGGVQQVWGLGVPLWRLPFEAGARLLGGVAFPGMLALALALAGGAWLLLTAVGEISRTVIGRPGAVSVTPLSRAGRGVLVWAGGAAVLVLFFPPLITLLQSRFAVYEEAVAYEYVYGLVLLAGLLRLAAQPTRRRFWILCTWAGLGGLVRPTLVLHGMAAVLAGARALWWGKRRGARALAGSWAVGLGLFCFGGGVLFLTNRVRFGAGFAFGHRLNVQHLYGSVYATRFDHPYQDEPLLSAARELFGLMFLAKEFNASDFYQAGVFPGQSNTVRWREVYLTTYDLSYVAWLAAWTGWAVWWRGRRGEGVVMAASLLLLLSWIPWEIGRGRSAYGLPRVLDWSEVAERMARKPAQVHLPANDVYESAAAARTTGIPYNGAGWLSAEGAVAPCVILFVTDPEFLELEVAPGPGAPEEGPVAWRAKVGLEFLERRRIERTAEGWKLRFAGPRKRQYQRGLQPVFLATVPKEQLARPRSPWRLLRVRWRESPVAPSEEP